MGRFSLSTQLQRKVLVFNADGIQTSVIGPGTMKAPAGSRSTTSSDGSTITDARDHNVKV